MNKLYTGYNDTLPREWAIEGEFSYLGRNGLTNRISERVDIAFCRKIQNLSESRTGDPMFWCGVELKRGREGAGALEKDIEKMIGRCGLSPLETCSMLAWGYVEGDGEDTALKRLEELRGSKFARSRWIYLPVGAYPTRTSAADKWIWMFFGEVLDTPEFTSHASRRTAIRRTHFAAWQADVATHDYYRGDWPIDGQKCSVRTCARCGGS